MAYSKKMGYKTKKILPGSYNEVNPKFEIQIDDVSAKALSHNFLLSVFQSLKKIVWLRKQFSEWNFYFIIPFSDYRWLYFWAFVKFLCKIVKLIDGFTLNSDYFSHSVYSENFKGHVISWQNEQAIDMFPSF